MLKIVFVVILISISNVHSDQIIDIINAYGYPSEKYTIQTEDYYILYLYRIPPAKPTKKVVFIMHGIISCAADFLVSGPEKALGFILANDGFDVWLGNARGTVFSGEHVYLKPSSPDFWNFSWHEIGKYDMPAMIDKILKVTNQTSLHVVGHSQGTTTFFVMLSLLPEYNQKIISGHLMGPAIFFKTPNFALQLICRRSENFRFIARNARFYELPRTNDFLKTLSSFLCTGNTSRLCVEMARVLAGIAPNSNQLNASLVSAILRNSPAGASSKQLIHFGQIIHSGNFAEFDYGQERNLKIYHKENPPAYNLTNVKVPLQILYTTNDFFVSVPDIQAVLRRFSKQIFDVVKVVGWGHLDFLFANDAANKVHMKILNALNTIIQRNNGTTGRTNV